MAVVKKKKEAKEKNIYMTNPSSKTSILEPEVEQKTNAVSRAKPWAQVQKWVMAARSMASDG